MLDNDCEDSDGYVPPSPEYFPDSPEPYTPSSPAYLSSDDDDDDDDDGDDEENVEKEEDESSCENNNSNDDGDGDGDEWEAYEDENNGQTYYYNPKTEETTWEKPARYKHVSIPKDDDEAATRSPAKEEGQAPEDDDMVEPLPDWIAYQDNEGRTYYYNSKTEVTQWERPDSFAPIDASPKDDEPKLRTAADDDNDDDVMDDGFVVGETNQKPESKEEGEEEGATEKNEEPTVIIDPITKALDALKEMDAILEPSCIAHVTDLVTNLGANEAYPKAIQCLSNSFHGQTAICGLLCNWIRNLAIQSSSTTTNGSNSSASYPNNLSSSSSSTASEETVRNIAETVIHGIVMEKYNKDRDENILRLRKRDVQFLEDMMDSDRWRRLLIDLSTKYKDSALLMFCLKSISRRGHHREIAGRNQSDYFGVFDSMLNYELSLIGKSWVETADLGDGLNISSNIGKNLRQTCTSTDYTYLHAMEALSDLISRATSICACSSSTSTSIKVNEKEMEGLQRAVRKWEKLKENLEEAMITSNNNSGSTMARKRRINLALTVSELHQRQRRRLDPTVKQEDFCSSSEKWKDAIDTSVLNLIKRHAIGMPFDLLLLNKLIKPATDDLLEQHGRYVGQLLISRPIAINALLIILYKPGGTVVKSLELKEKCATLLARAVLAARREPCLSSSTSAAGDEDEGESTLEKDSFSKVQKDLMEGSELCDQVGNMVSFTVLDDENAHRTSVGIRLSALSIMSALVSKGVILWATELVKGSDFFESAAYPTLTPCILSLVRVIATHHPFCREDVLGLACIVLEHAVPEDLSYQKVESLKRQCLRLLLSLCSRGLALNVFNSLSERLQKRSTAIDSSLIRYFIGGVLEIVNPPFSISFVKCLSTMLLLTPCIEALCSTSFEQGTLLQKFIQNIISMVDQKDMSSVFTENERRALSSLTLVYSNSEAGRANHIPGFVLESKRI